MGQSENHSATPAPLRPILSPPNQDSPWQVIIHWAGRIGDKSGALGAIVSTMGCAMCFPALASIGAALGLGFLSQWEGLFINTLLPLFAWIALGANALGWLSHRQWHRSVAGMVGPAMVLLSLYPWFQ